MYILNCNAISKEVDEQTQAGKEIKEVIQLVTKCLKVQINNFHILLKGPTNEGESSLVEQCKRFSD